MAFLWSHMTRLYRNDHHFYKSQYSALHRGVSILAPTTRLSSLTEDISYQSVARISVLSLVLALYFFMVFQCPDNGEGTPLWANQRPVSLFSNSVLSSTNLNKSALYCMNRNFVVLMQFTAFNAVRIANLLHTQWILCTVLKLQIVR